MSVRRSILTVAVTAVLCAQPLLGKSDKWVGTWASAPLVDAHGKSAEELFGVGAAPGVTGATLREVVHVSMGGETLRVRFSNLYGTAPLVIATAEIAQTAKGASIVPGTNKPLSFHGKPSVSIPAGGACCERCSFL